MAASGPIIDLFLGLKRKRLIADVFSKRFVMPPTAAFKIRRFSLPVFVCLSPTHRHIHSSLRFWSMCTGCKSHWIKVIVVVVHGVVSWKQLKCHAERVQADCLGCENAMSQRRSELSRRREDFFFTVYEETGSCRRGRQKRDRQDRNIKSELIQGHQGLRCSRALLLSNAESSAFRLRLSIKL